MKKRDSWEDDEPQAGGLGPCIVGPMGVIPLNESNQPGKLFKFWMGHTNFRLTQSDMSQMSDVPGVEAVDVISQYRFRLAVGQLFSSKKVMKAITRTLCTTEPKLVVKQGLEAVKAVLMASHKHWAIYLMPTGHYQTAVGESPTEVKLKGAAYSEVATETVVSWNA
jgi:hypothetical protein